MRNKPIGVCAWCGRKLDESTLSPSHHKKMRGACRNCLQHLRWIRDRVNENDVGMNIVQYVNDAIESRKCDEANGKIESGDFRLDSRLNRIESVLDKLVTALGGID